MDDGSGVGKHAIAGDGIGDTLIPHPVADFDNFPFVTAVGDSDVDGIPDAVDNCPTVSNPLQTDDNMDGFGDACVALDAVIADDVMLGDGVIIGDGAIIDKGASVGDNSAIGADRVRIGNGEVISKDTVIADDTDVPLAPIVNCPA